MATSEEKLRVEEHAAERTNWGERDARLMTEAMAAEDWKFLCNPMRREASGAAFRADLWKIAENAIDEFGERWRNLVLGFKENDE